MRDKLRVLVDLDSIVTDIYEAWYWEYNRRYGDDLTVEKTKEWDVTKFALAGSAVFDVIREPGFYRRLLPLPGAVLGLEELSAHPRVDVFLLSSVPPRAYSAWGDKAVWVDGVLPFVGHERLILAHSKYVVEGDVLFDDGPHNLLSYAEERPHARLATIAYPYNEAARERLGCNVRVCGDYQNTQAAWADFVAWVKELAS